MNSLAAMTWKTPAITRSLSADQWEALSVSSRIYCGLPHSARASNLSRGMRALEQAMFVALRIRVRFGHWALGMPTPPRDGGHAGRLISRYVTKAL